MSSLSILKFHLQIDIAFDNYLAQELTRIVSMESKKEAYHSVENRNESGHPLNVFTVECTNIKMKMINIKNIVLIEFLP